MNYKSFNIGDWIGHISGVIEDESELDGNEMRDLVEFLSILKQKSCTDAISRQAVDELSKELVHTTRDKADFLCNFWEGLQKLPSVTPKEKTGWIPVSERLPEKLKDVLVAFYDCPDEYDVAYLRTTFNETYKKNGAKHEWVSAMGETTYADYEVDAWIPIEPYKAESEDKNADSN